MNVVFLVLPKVNLLDLSGPAQVFSAAAHAGADYALSFVGGERATVSAQGLELSGLGALTPVGADDLVVIAGPDLSGHGATDTGPVTPEVLDWVRAAHGAGAHLASICTGAVVLGEAGLLDGRTCTSHRSVLAAMRQRYPTAHVVDDVLFVHDGRVSTSAGIASGIDLALSLLELRHGPALAAAVAGELVVFVRRNGSAAPMSPFLAHRDHLNPAVHRVQDILTTDFGSPHTLESLGAAVHLSPRGLSRAFAEATGTTPLRYQQELRMSHAEALLSTTDRSIDEIAASCGYTDTRHFRRLFGARHRISPATYRAAVREH